MSLYNNTTLPILCAASVQDLKQSGVVPRKAMELFDIVPEMLIACFTLVFLLLHCLFSFTIEYSG